MERIYPFVLIFQNVCIGVFFFSLNKSCYITLAYCCFTKTSKPDHPINIGLEMDGCDKT